MDLKGTLKAITLELRRELEGTYDAQRNWQPGDLERRLAAIGVRRDRPPVPVDELPHLSVDDREARRVVDAFLQSRAETGQSREAAIADFVREAAYSWANRLLALRCMEARGLIDEVILQKDIYGGRSLQHQRLVRKEPERCSGEDEGLLAVLFDEFARRAKELPLLFDPRASEVALRPSVAALKRCIALLSGTLAAKGQEAATDEVFTAPDALGWTYQYWNTEEKNRVFEKVRTEKGAKIEGAEIVPATCIYTEPYMVKFLVQNSLGAMWMGMNPDSHLREAWEYYVPDADRAPVSRKAVSEITFLDPACGSGHFLIEAFEIFYAMYLEEGAITDPAKICAAILERNLYGIDIDERAVQIAALALVMKAKEKAPEFVPRQVNLVATNIRLPAGKEHLEAFLRQHPEDAPLKPALLAIFEGLAHADEIGSLLQIEELVEEEFRHLRDQQLDEERRAGATSLFGPRREEDWAAWKHDVIERLRQHFDGEAEAPDLATMFFGEAATKGLSLVDLLARRYDVVAANPPYLGSKKMGAVLKLHLERHFAAGKRDIYAAFILCCLRLALEGGKVAMVTQQSWMFLRSFADLRALDDEKRRKAPRAFSGILRETAIETLGHLGSRAFREISGEVVNTALFVLARRPLDPDHRLTAFRLVGATSPEEKDRLLRTRANATKLRQARLLSISETPLSYWLTDRLLALLHEHGPDGREEVRVSQGLTTGNVPRFVRYGWEAASNRPTRRWRWYTAGGGFCRWAGHEYLVVDWENDGARVKAFVSENYPPEKFTLLIKQPDTFGQDAVYYGTVACGSLGARLCSDAIFGDAAPGVLHSRMDRHVLAGILCCRLSSFLVRALSASILSIRDAYVVRLPLYRRPITDECEKLLRAAVTTAWNLKRQHVTRWQLEHSFDPESVSVAAPWNKGESDDAAAETALLHAIEGWAERLVFAGYGLASEDAKAVVAETGTPAGWFPLVSGYDRLPEPEEPTAQVPPEFRAFIATHERVTLDADALDALKMRVRLHYETGSGGTVSEDATDAASGEDDEEEVGAAAAYTPIPTETLIEEFSQKLEVHPVSIYWIVREIRDAGVVCRPEHQRSVQDYITYIVLRLLGHRWPREIDAEKALPAWADRGGIIPISDGMEEPTLLARVRGRLAEDIGANRVRATEREFQEIVGKSLDEWLAADFFKRHISQFKKRPIVWQIESLPGGSGKRARRAVRKAPAFSCLVYYHRLDADLLPKFRTQYVGPLRTSAQTELAGLEKLSDRTTDQAARRLELEEKLEELKAFDARLEQVISGGFISTGLDALAGKGPLDKWTSRDGRASVPTSREAFLAQERKYDPDLNDGVRVNIAPLQRAGLLAAHVLAAKDVEKAIADRAEWRADERRWCREGKLPRPGWWPEEGTL